MTQHNDIEVSFVIAAWNSASFINKAIYSALNQANISLEVIVVDDLSTDNTIQIVNSINDDRVRLIESSINVGPGGARNLGFDAARGKWIAVLDSDDEMMPERLSTMLSMTTGDTDIILDNFYEKLDNKTKLTPFYKDCELPIGSLSLDFLIGSNLLFSNKKSTGYLKPVFKSSFLKKTSIKYWPEVRIGEDYFFLACCLANNAKAQVVPYAGYIYNIRGDSISRVLKLQDIQVLLKFDKKFQKLNSLNEASLVSQYERTNNLYVSLNYLKIIDLLKGQYFVDALVHCIKHPFSALLLKMPIKKRLKGFVGTYDAKAN